MIHKMKQTVEVKGANVSGKICFMIFGLEKGYLGRKISFSLKQLSMGFPLI